MDKEIRDAVRSYLIRDNKILAIRYKGDEDGYYDIPGGKVEENETPEEASIREFMEETGMTVTKQHAIGRVTIDYPKRFFNFTIFRIDDYEGEPLSLQEDDSMWIDIDDLEREIKVFPSVRLIQHLEDGMNLNIECDENHNILKLEEINDL